MSEILKVQTRIEVLTKKLDDSKTSGAAAPLGPIYQSLKSMGIETFSSTDLGVLFVICRAKTQITEYSRQLNSFHDEIAEIRANHKVTKTIDKETLGSNILS